VTQGSNVVSTTIKLQKSSPNAEAIKAVAEGISEGLVKGAGKAIVPVP
jgi:phenylpyruvate tautomerase PptA (4-oxalocrotonate tautomerase family)